MKYLIPITFAVSLLAACGQPDSQNSEPSQTAAEDKTTTIPAQEETSMPDQQADSDMPAFPAEMAYCPDVRPEVCTMEYDPVLGFKANGESMEYGNKCSACSDAEVVGYIKIEGELE